MSILYIRYLQVSYNAPCLPPKKFCISIVFLLGQLQYPGEMKNKSYAKLFGGVGGGATEVYYGRCANGEWVMEQSN